VAANRWRITAMLAPMRCAEIFAETGAPRDALVR
jgi:hypothetical protein